jgi:hypothetical protein
MELNNEAWEMLTRDEQSALKLQLGMGKSSWQSGEIMNRSHYKYLEIKYRAEHFLKTFTEYAKMFGTVFPQDVKCHRVVMQYLSLCIKKRMKPKAAMEELNKDKRITKAYLNEKLIQQIEEWQMSQNTYDVTFLNLVMDFDRWNNFRILPKAIQEPSAFKRRVKNFYKKQIKITTTINTLSLDKLIKTYRTKGIGAWVGIMYNVGKGKKACTDGLDFWPKYRDLIHKAKNYLEIQKLIPSRRYLELALAKHEFI